VNGPQDMGGLHGFGRVYPESDEPPFHAGWEGRAMALTLAMAVPGGWNIDMSRAARESIPPADYLRMTYYEIWIAGLETLMAERRLVSPNEIAAGRVLDPARPVTRILSVDRVTAALQAGNSTERPAPAPARFRQDDMVRAKNIHPVTHTRLPRYVRGHFGTVEHVRGCQVFPDSNAKGNGESPQWLYTVRFDGRELWGADSDPTVKVSVDAWEPYLEPA
jgi:nitrile hydratase subunit beta